MTKDWSGMMSREEGDVELSKKGLEPLQSFTRKTKTTVHRLVTHEPMPRFVGFSCKGVVPQVDERKAIGVDKFGNTIYAESKIYDDKMDAKQWLD